MGRGTYCPIHDVMYGIMCQECFDELDDEAKETMVLLLKIKQLRPDEVPQEMIDRQFVKYAPLKKLLKELTTPEATK